MSGWPIFSYVIASSTCIDDAPENGARFLRRTLRIEAIRFLDERVAATTTLRDAARCTQPGDLAPLLCREGLYSSHLAAWRAAERRGELAGPTRRRGPTATPVGPQGKRVAELERQLAKATARAERAEGLVALQKKVAELFGQTLDTPDEPR